MINFSRIGVRLCSIGTLILLLGCSSHSRDANPMPDSGSFRFSLDTPIERIAATQGGKEVLDRMVPGLMASRSYPLLDDMSLSQVATLSGGRISREKLNEVEAQLVQLNSHSQ